MEPINCQFGKTPQVHNLPFRPNNGLTTYRLHFSFICVNIIPSFLLGRAVSACGAYVAFSVRVYGGRNQYG